MLFTFPSRYSCTIGRRGVFRLGGWSPHVQTGFHVPRPTRGPLRTLRLRGCHPLRRTFPDPSASFAKATGLLRFRSPLLAESPLMSFPPGTEMFQFPGFASPAYGFGRGSPKKGGVPPFGHPRINDRSHLPAAFRSVPRPSSPLGAKASTERPFHAPDRNRHRPHAGPSRAQQGHAPSSMRGRGGRTIRAHSHFHSRNYTTNSGFTCERTTASPARSAGEAGLLEAAPVRARSRSRAPLVRGIPMRTDTKHPPPRSLATCAARAGCQGIESGERSPPIGGKIKEGQQPKCLSIPYRGLVLERR